MIPDRRTSPRRNLAFPVLVEGPFGWRRCMGRDISPGGLFLETPDPYVPGTRVRVIFSLPDGSWEVMYVCEVRHCARARDREGHSFGVGLAFVNVEPDTHDRFSPSRRLPA